MRDTLLATRTGGSVCFTGMLRNVWTVPDWYPMDYIPNGVRLTVYSGDATDLPPAVLQSFLDDLESGRLTPPAVRPYPLDQIVEAHRAMEANEAAGKLVVVT
jgi:NADPH:quinone reductase-like Zn-dependent oxidoreductase